MQKTASWQSTIDDGPRVPGFLAVVWSPDTRLRGKVYDFRRRPVAIGRTVDAVDADERLSGEHFEVRCRRGRATVHHGTPRNGTQVDGRPLPAEHDAPLADGTVLRAGDTLFVVYADEPGPRFFEGAIIPGRAPDAVYADAYADRVAEAGRHALVLGPSGAGKENVGRAMHNRGPRSEARFVRVDCTGLRHDSGLAGFFGVEPRTFTGVAERAGILERTPGGTLFLDEIGDLDPEVQARMLRLLETGHYQRQGFGAERHTDARIIGATLRDVSGDDAVMRSDLYHRFTRFQQPIQVPSLSERAMDIVDWIRVVSGGLEGPDTVTAGFIEACLLWSWPGNLRELASEISTARLRPEAEPGAPLHARLLSADVRRLRQQRRKEAIGRLVVQTDLTDAELKDLFESMGHNLSEVARLTGLSRRTVRRRLQSPPEP